MRIFCWEVHFASRYITGHLHNVAALTMEAGIHGNSCIETVHIQFIYIFFNSDNSESS